MTIFYNASLIEGDPDPTFFKRIPDDKLVDAYFNWFNRSQDLYMSIHRERAQGLIWELNRRLEGLAKHRDVKLKGFIVSDRHGHHHLHQ